jgi:hypothetical protein
MPDYRFYAIRTDGHVDGPPAAHDLPNDAAAVAKAKQFQNGHDIEIWQGTRVVAYLVSDDPQPPSSLNATT